MWKYPLGALLVMHGIIHAMGLAAGEPTLPVGPMGPVFDVWWLLAAIALIGAGLGVIVNRPWWRPMALVGIASSVILVIWWWSDAWPGLIANAVILAAVLVAPRLTRVAVR